MKLLVVGAGDLGKTLAYHIDNDTTDDVVGFLDDTLIVGSIVQGKKVVGKIDDAQLLFNQGIADQFVIAIGYKHFDFRAEVFKNMKNIAPIYKFIHSSSYVDASTKIGEGVLVFPGCIIDMGCILEDNVLLNTGVVIAHDSIVKKHSFVAPSVTISGFSEIGEKCFIGTNATVVDKVKIGNSIQIGAASLVLKSIEKKGLYIGSPVELKK